MITSELYQVTGACIFSWGEGEGGDVVVYIHAQAVLKLHGEVVGK